VVQRFGIGLVIETSKGRWFDQTGLQKLELVIKERTPRCLGHVLRMEDSRIPRQAIQWELRGYKRKPGQPGKNWMDIIRQDLKDMDITWDEAKELVTDRAEWRQRVAQCTYLDVE